MKATALIAGEMRLPAGHCNTSDFREEGTCHFFKMLSACPEILVKNKNVHPMQKQVKDGQVLSLLRIMSQRELSSERRRLVNSFQSYSVLFFDFLPVISLHFLFGCLSQLLLWFSRTHLTPSTFPLCVFDLSKRGDVLLLQLLRIMTFQNH